MRQTMLLAAAILLVACAAWWFTRPQPVPHIMEGVPNETYTDSALGFSMEYPKTAIPSPVSFEGYLPLTQTPVVSFTLPRDMFAGTNLAEAGVYIGATSSPAVLAVCTSASQESGEQKEASESIGGVPFSVFTSADAGAGNFYERKTYRAVMQGACVEIVEMLHSLNIGNFTPGAVVEFDKEKYQGILGSIVHTFRSA